MITKKFVLVAAPGYDKLKNGGAPKVANRKTFKAGAGVLEPDLSNEAAEAIVPLMPKRSRKQKFFGKVTAAKSI